MKTYSKEKLQTSLTSLLNDYINHCLKTGKPAPDFVELIRHNFYAKYVHYNDADEMIEIGINESREPAPFYPEIKVYSYPVSKAGEWLGTSFKKDPFDLAFYNRLLNGKKSISNS